MFESFLSGEIAKREAARRMRKCKLGVLIAAIGLILVIISIDKGHASSRSSLVTTSNTIAAGLPSAAGQ